MAGLGQAAALASVIALVASALVASPAQAATRTVQVGSEAAFTNTSGTILCAFWDGSVRCDVRNRRFTPPRRPRSCDVDWGDSLSLGSRAGFGCIGDTVGGLADLRQETTRWFSNRNGVKAPSAYRGGAAQAGLRPGIALRSGRITCMTTTKQAVTCTNTKTKRGFTVSRTSYRLR